MMQVKHSETYTSSEIAMYSYRRQEPILKINGRCKNTIAKEACAFTKEIGIDFKIDDVHETIAKTQARWQEDCVRQDIIKLRNDGARSFYIEGIYFDVKMLV